MSSNIQLPWQQESIILHSLRLIKSYEHWTGCSLVEAEGSPLQLAQVLFEAPFPVFSHGTESDPIYNYGNQKALDLWELDWEQLTQMPSRYSAESMDREERLELLNQVTSKGYLSNGRGIRVSSSGKRYMISDFTIWNLLDNDHRYCGQAATFSQWKPISP